MEKTKAQKLAEEKELLIADLRDAITNDEQRLFDRYLKRFKRLLRLKLVTYLNIDVIQARKIKKSDSELVSDLFGETLTKPNRYYREILYHMCNKYTIFSRKDTQLLRICIREGDPEMAHRFIERGANLYALDTLCCTPLEDAIRCNSLEMVCMLLHYCAYTNNIENNLTSFMFSIICKSSEEIQRVLMDYEVDYNLTCDGEPILWMAIKFHSPLVFDLIKRGADASFTRYINNGLIPTPFVAIRCNHDVKTVAKLWDLFDYNVWQENLMNNDPPSMICSYLKYFSSETSKYLPVLLNNEKQLRLDINHHVTRIPGISLISDFYTRCCRTEQLDEETMQNYVIHLLSQGAVLYRSDIDQLYSLSRNKDSKFFDVLLSLDFVFDNSPMLTFMYFRYTLIPTLDEFTAQVMEFYKDPVLSATGDVRDFVRRLSEIFAFDYNTKKRYCDIFGEDEETMSHLKMTACFPSLVQLSRDATRRAICNSYDIQTVNKFYSVVQRLEIPNFIKMLLMYRKKIYRM